MARERQQAIKLKLPQEIADRAEKMCRRRGWTLDELVQTAVIHYVDGQDWEGLLTYGSEESAERGLSPDDVEQLVDEYRSDSIR
jgi:hypothetical protein